MIHSAGGWRLSPVYDLTPSFLQGTHATTIDGKAANITLENIINEGKRFGFSKAKTVEIVDNLRISLSDWSDIITDDYARKKIDVRMNLLFDSF